MERRMLRKMIEKRIKESEEIEEVERTEDGYPEGIHISETGSKNI